MRWEPPGLGGERDLAGTASHLLMSLASGTFRVFSREAQSSPACRKTNLLQMKMACLLLSRSHLNGSVSLDIICCVRSLFWACTDGDLHGHHFQKCCLPQTRCSSFLLWDPVLFFLFLTLETNLLQTVSSGLQLCSFPLSDAHPANISAVNGAEPSQWQLLPFTLPVPSNLVFLDLCIPTYKTEVNHTLPRKQSKQKTTRRSI